MPPAGGGGGGGIEDDDAGEEICLAASFASIPLGFQATPPG